MAILFRLVSLEALAGASSMDHHHQPPTRLVIADPTTLETAGLHRLGDQGSTLQAEVYTHQRISFVKAEALEWREEYYVRSHMH